MRTTLDLDDALVAKAKFLTGHDDIAKIVHEALAALVQRESARRLALRGGTEPILRLAPRRRPRPRSASRAGWQRDIDNGQVAGSPWAGDAGVAPSACLRRASDDPVN